MSEGQSLNIRGAYFTAVSSRGDKSLIDFFVLDPERRVVYSRRKMPEGVFSFNASIPGQHLMVFSN